MNNSQKILNLLGLATRARKVVLGQEFVIKELARNPKSIIFLANDSGNNLTKKINNKAKTYEAIVIDKFNTTEISKAIGKQNRKIVLVTDKGFIQKFLEYINS
jgi:ribosomal protein L7Ae-like RNA K-turn-binding protein